MSRELIGLDTLPNVYISKIEVMTKGKKNVVVANVYARDFIGDDGEPSWCNRPSTKDKLSFLFFYSHDQTTTEAISDGRMPIDTIRTNYVVNEFTHKKNIGDPTVVAFMRNKNKAEYVREGDNVFLHMKFKFEVPNSLDLAVFCCLMYDFPKEYYNRKNKYVLNKSGPIASEYILKDGILQNTTTVFVNSDNEQWIGPVHFHESKGYMEGSKHSNQSHRALKRVSIPNLKIVNHTNIPSQKRLFEKRNPISNVSELFYSFGSNRKLSALFAVDYREILITKTKYGHFLQALDKEEFSNILNSFKIIKLKILKRKTNRRSGQVIEETEAISSMGTVGKLERSIKVQVDQREEERFATEGDTTPALYKLHESDYKYEGNPGIKIYEFQDNVFGDTTFGVYRYAIKIIFEDPTIKYVRDMFSMSRDSLNNMKKLYNLLNRKENYNYKLDKVKEAFFTNTEYDSLDWKRAALSYFRCHNLLLQPYATLEQFKHSIVSKIHPNTATLLSMKLFIESYQKLMKNMYNTFGLSVKDITGERGSSVAKQLSNHMQVNVISFDYEFKEEINAIENKKFYNYLHSEDKEGILELDASEFSDRVRKEEVKFQKADKKSYFSYLSPASAQSVQKKIDMSIVDNIDVQELNTFFERTELVKRKTLDIRFFLLRPDEEREDKRFDLIESEDFLGKDSKFIKYQEFRDVCFKPEKKFNFLKSTQSIGTIGLPLFIHPKEKPPQVSPKKIDDIYDRIGSAETDIVIKTNFFLLQKIEVFKGFTMDNLKLPVWGLLKESDISNGSQDLLCRMSYYDPTASTVEPELRLPLSNRFFFITPLRVRPIAMQTSEMFFNFNKFDTVINYNLDGATSNIVTQSFDNGIITSWDSDLAFGLGGTTPAGQTGGLGAMNQTGGTQGGGYGGGGGNMGGGSGGGY